MFWHNFNEKNIGVWGMGKEGVAACTALEKYTRPKALFTLDDSHLENLLKCDIVIKSPGVSLYRPELAEAQKKGIQIVSGSSLFMANKSDKTRVIGVTGTKGKSTTSSLLYHLLKTAGLDVAFGGNIGEPLLNLLQAPAPEFVVAELSSYQCADFTGVCDYALLTNLFPEHLQWHGSHEQYYADKCHMLAQSKMIFVNGENKTVLAHLPLLSQAHFFNTPHTFHLKDGFFYQGNTPLFEQSVLNLTGTHNAENACAVLSIANQLGIGKTVIKKAFQTFQPLPHRLQPIGIYKGILFIDDSISTTPETTIAAIQAFNKGQPITVLIGGYDRGQDFKTLIDFLTQTQGHFHLIALPDTGIRAYKLAEAAHLSATKADTIAEAVRQAYHLTPQGGCVILSPGSPSYNQYRNFEERGADFKKHVQEYGESVE